MGKQFRAECENAILPRCRMRCVCVHVYMCECIGVHVCACMCGCVSVSVYACVLFVCVCVYASMCMCGCVSVHVGVHLCAHVCKCERYNGRFVFHRAVLLRRVSATEESSEKSLSSIKQMSQVMRVWAAAVVRSTFCSFWKVLQHGD